jgi:hypothetical protein
LEEADATGAAALDKYGPAAEGMVGVGSSFSRSHAVAKSLPAADGMVGGCAYFLRSHATKRSSAVTKEHACEAEASEEADTMGAAALDKYVPAAEGMVGVGSSFLRSHAVAKSLPAADGMVGGCASFLHYRVTKRSSAVTKEHACEAEALEEADTMGAAALEKYVPAAEGMVGVGSSFSRSRAVAKSLPAADGMVGGCASFSYSHATKRSSTVTKDHAYEAEALEEAEEVGAAALDKSVPAADGMVGVGSSFLRSHGIVKSLPAAGGMVGVCASFSCSRATKRSSAVTKEHACEAEALEEAEAVRAAALEKSVPAAGGMMGVGSSFSRSRAVAKSLPAADGMVGDSASFSHSRATKRSSAVTKEHTFEAEALEEADAVGAAALEKSVPATDGMVGVGSSFLRSRAIAKSLPAADGMVGGCAYFLRSRVTKRSSAVTKEHACEVDALEEANAMGAAALDKYVPAAEGIVGIGSSFSRSRTIAKSLPAADGVVGVCASFSHYRATKRSSAVTKEHACEAEALEDAEAEAEAVGAPDLDKYVPAAEGMVGVGSSFSRSHAVAKSLPAADGMVGGCASFSHSHATKRSSTITKDHAYEAESLEEADTMGAAALDKYVPAADGMVGVVSYFLRSRGIVKSLPAAGGMVGVCASFSCSHATKRSSAVTKEHACEADALEEANAMGATALDKCVPDAEGIVGVGSSFSRSRTIAKSLPAADGMVGDSASFSHSRATKRSSAVTKEHACEAEALEEAEAVGAAALEKYVPATEGMVGVGSSFSRSRAIAKFLPTTDGMVGDSASFSRSRAPKRSSAVMKEHACEADALEEAEAVGAAAVDKYVLAAEGMVGMEASVIDLAASPCSNCPHKNAWVAMMTKSDDVSGTHKAAWEDCPWCKSFFGDTR